MYMYGIYIYIYIECINDDNFGKKCKSKLKNKGEYFKTDISQPNIQLHVNNTFINMTWQTA